MEKVKEKKKTCFLNKTVNPVLGWIIFFGGVALLVGIGTIVLLVAQTASLG